MNINGKGISAADIMRMALQPTIDRQKQDAAKVDSVLISNQTRADFEKHTNQSILSRMHEHGCTIVCDWQPFR